MVSRVGAGVAGAVLAFSCAAAPPAWAMPGPLVVPDTTLHRVAAPLIEPDEDIGQSSPLSPFTPFKQGPDQTDDTLFEPEDAPAPQDTDVDTSNAPEVHYGETDLPSPVARMRRALMDAAKTGNVEELRGVFEQNEMPPSLGFESYDDPIEFLKSQSGDPEGREILALLLEILEAGWVHVDEGGPQEMYIWPYFDQWPLDGLSPSQEVELYRILTAGDVEEMRRHGGYIFFRVGIGPDGTLHYFMPSP